MAFRSLALLSTLGFLSLFIAQSTASLAQEGEGTVSASFSVIEPLVIVDTAIVPSASELNDLEAALEPIVGVDLTITMAPIEIIPSVTPGSELTIPLPLTGAPEGLFPGDINFTLGNLAVETTVGITGAIVQFGPVLAVRADASLAGTDEGGLSLTLSGPHLIFVPPDPDALLLPGGDPTVTEIAASFDVELTKLPDGAALDVTFAKDTSTLLGDSAAKFLVMADSVDGEMGPLDNDVAFGISVVKFGIVDESLGDNLVTLEVSKAWFDAKIGEGKRILIAKFDDAGEPVPPPQDATDSCTSGTDPVVCSVTLFGLQGGLALFFLVAITMENSPPVASAAFSPIAVEPGEGTFQIVATATDPDGDPLVINSFLITPSLIGLEIELEVGPLVEVSFEFKEGKVEINGPDSEATLASLRKLGGFAVENGQTIKTEIGAGPNVELKKLADESVGIKAAGIILEVTARDTVGASNTDLASPIFPPSPLESGEGGGDDVSEEESAQNDDDAGSQPNANFQIVVSQARARIVSDTQSRIHTPDGKVEIIIPDGFLSPIEMGKSIEIEIKNLDPGEGQFDADGVTHIRSIEVNALVDGRDGSISVGEAATLIIPLNPQDIAMAGGRPSTLTVRQLDPATGEWEPLSTVYRGESTPARLEASLEEFRHTALRVFQSAIPGTKEIQLIVIPEPIVTGDSFVHAGNDTDGRSAGKVTAVAIPAGAVLLLLLTSAAMLRRRRAGRLSNTG